MHVIIVGAGKIGFHLAKTLIEEGCNITVVDRKSDSCYDAAVELECNVVRGDATKPRVLEEAGIREADTLIALTGSDETNLIICSMAKQLGAKNVAAKLNSLYYEEETLKKLGLDLVIYPEAAAAGYISELITKPEIFDLIYLARGEIETVRIDVKKKSKITGKKIKEIEQPKGSVIIALIEKEKIKIPDQETEIKAGDKLLLLGKKDKIKQIKKMT